HQNVGRETQFQRLIPNIYHVAVDGALIDPDNGEVLLRPFDEHPVEVRQGETVRLEIAMQPRECPVDVHVMWDKQPTEDAGVSVRGLPNSLRYTRAGSARLRLCMGNHTVVVGSGDRVAEREIDVQSFSPTAVTIDLAGSEGVVFKGCPPAVKPYLHGDHNAAARALSRDGHNRIANVLLARLHVDLGQTSRAADYFKAAGQPLEAAELRASLEDYAGAAVLFAEAGQANRSAQMYRSAGQWIKAGSSFEAIDDYRAAADCFREGDDVGRWLGALERNGDYFEAAQIALEHSDRARAIRLLQLVPLDSPNYSDACELLADAFEHEGHADLAAQKIEQRMSAGETSPDLQCRLATLLETSGEYNRALDVLETLRDDEPTYPNIASRIEGLRKKITAQSLSQPTGSRTNPNTATPTAFLSEQRYEILEELGRGGMGVVFKARDLRLNREVALKQLPENLREHPKAIQLFLREAQACARLNHRNIVTIFDTDQDDTNFFITMELLEGYPLNVIRRKRGRLAVRDAARLGVQVAEGLAYAHKQGIVHRDIKTANLFFTTDKVVKIMDFGLAKMMEEVRRGTTVLGGTPYYMAPEQAKGGSVDQRADIYAFGVTLYELVTGGVPFDDGDVSYHHQHTPVTDPRERAADIGDDIAVLILRMMEKDPDRRPADAAEIGKRLAAIASC
ncbi:MAG: protein kinase, partial [bacterium]|nr:protein kinase [bacterium]